jgi:fused signal recognition particle receptor
MGLFDKLFKRNKEQQEQKEALDEGLQKTKQGFFQKITKAIAGKEKVDEEVLDSLEEALITSDVGLETTVAIIERIEARAARDKYVSTGELNRILQEEMMSVLTDSPVVASNDAFALAGKEKPYVLLVVGVNGVGKTTTIGKLAAQFKAAGKSVVLGAADTFRAAAVDQLTIWSERVGVPIVKKEMGSDPSSVAFEAVAAGIAQGADIVIIDTAGRLHNKGYLMDELGKIRRVISKKMKTAPHEVMLVLDGSTGQNALEQAKQFTAATDVNSIAITKLDGTAKGGVVLAIAHRFKIPVKYIGVGERVQDLQLFNKEEFVDSLFSLETAQ